MSLTATAVSALVTRINECIGSDEPHFTVDDIRRLAAALASDEDAMILFRCLIAEHLLRRTGWG